MLRKDFLILGALLSVLFFTGCSFSEPTSSIGESTENVPLTVEKNEIKPQETWLYPAYIFKDNEKKWGYINNEGKFVIDAAYSSAGNFYKNGLAIVSNGGKFGLIDKKGKLVLNSEYKYITYLDEGLFSAEHEKGSNLIDANGKSLFTTDGSIGKFSNGLSVISQKVGDKEYKYGYINTEGKVVIDTQYNYANEFNNSKALVKTKDGKNIVIGKNGENLASINYDIIRGLSDGTIIYKFNDKFGYLDDEGNILIEAKYQNAEPFSDGFAIVNYSDKSYSNSYGLINKKGEFVIEPKNIGLWQVDDSLYAVSEKGFNSIVARYGPKFLINNEGKRVSDLEYYDIEKFTGDVTSANDENSTFFIDKNGNKVPGLPKVDGTGVMEITGDMVKVQIDHDLLYLTKDGKKVWQSDITYTLQDGITVKSIKYSPNRVTLVYYPQISGLLNKEAQDKINNELKDRFIDTGSDVEKVDGMYAASIDKDFSVSLNKDLFTIVYSSYYYPFGAAHGQPAEFYFHIDRNTGKFYTLSDLFKKDSSYTKILSDIVGKQIDKKIKEDDFFIFKDSYKGIRPDHYFTVNKDALQVYFFPYEIASYAQGFVNFDIPYGEIKDIIDTEGAFWKSFDKNIIKDSNNQASVTPAPDDTNVQINRAIENYEKNIVEAINKNDFDIVKPYIVKDSNLYKAQMDLVQSLNKQGIKEKLVGFTVKEAKQQTIPGQFKVYVDESIAIQYPGKDYITKEFSYIYTLVKSEGGSEFRLSDIEKWDK